MIKRALTPELLVLTALSALTHFWKLFTPNAVVFDEVHYKHFAGTYLAGTRYFDVHPPLANLLYAGVARVFGISATTLLGDEPAVQLRLLPALLGTLVVPLVYVILRQLGAARRTATLGAFAVLCENALLVDSRLTLIEPLLICFGLVAVTLYLAARGQRGAARWLLLGASAFFAGCALAAKWTGASALGLITVAWFFEQPRTRATLRHTFAEGALLVAIAASVYVATFAIHFHLGPRPDPAASMPLLSRMAQLHGRMAAGNRNLEAVVHAGASPWYTWPIMKHPIALWQDEASFELSQRHMVLLGNPVVWWGALIVVGAAAIQFARRRDVASRHRFALAFLSGGLLINFVPFMGIRRVMYLYHYLFALIFLVMLGAYCCGVLAGWNDGDGLAFPSRRSAIGYWSVAALILVGFFYFLPFTYGWPLTPASYDQHFWVLHPF